jgi:outer membrane protein assembly factor BamB
VVASRRRTAALVALVLASGVAACSTSDAAVELSPVAAVVTTTTTSVPVYDGWVDPGSSGQPWPGAATRGMLTLRGNPTRSWMGEGPAPRQPVVRWRYPSEGRMCATSRSLGVTSKWCGTGWTGQALTLERPDGSTWVLFGAFDNAFHVVDAATGVDVFPPLPVGDLAKGSTTLDPDGFPLWYTGARDGLFRVIALDRPQLEVLWELPAKSVGPTLWNDDWDGAALVLDDHLFVGGENSRLHVVKLNRSYGPDGRVQVAPQLLWHAAGWDDELLAAIGDRDVSIEGSVMVTGNTLWHANSGGLVQGWDLSGLSEGRMPERVFRFWTGDDTDATIVADRDGMLYVGSEYQRGLRRAREVGQLMKLDPRVEENPVLWSRFDLGYKGFEGASGVWGTPALYEGLVITTTARGEVLAVDQQTGDLVWSFVIPGPVIGSVTIVDGVLVIGDCSGVLHGYDVSEPRSTPRVLWEVTLGGCIESVPTVWQGSVYVGTRGGAVYALSDP